MQDLIAGRIDYLCIEPPVARPQIEAKTIKAIAVLSQERSSSLPSVPTAQEQGAKDIDITNWFALFAPKNTNAAVVKKLHDATVAAMETETLQTTNEADRRRAYRAGAAFIRLSWDVCTKRDRKVGRSDQG